MISIWSLRLTLCVDSWHRSLMTHFCSVRQCSIFEGVHFVVFKSRSDRSSCSFISWVSMMSKNWSQNFFTAVFLNFTLKHCKASPAFLYSWYILLFWVFVFFMLPKAWWVSWNKLSCSCWYFTISECVFISLMKTLHLIEAHGSASQLIWLTVLRRASAEECPRNAVWTLHWTYWLMYAWKIPTFLWFMTCWSTSWDATTKVRLAAANTWWKTKRHIIYSFACFSSNIVWCQYLWKPNCEA